MALGGVVITVQPADSKDVEIALSGFSALSIYGSDERGHIIASIYGIDELAIENVIKSIKKIHAVMDVNLAFLNPDNRKSGGLP